MPSDAPAEIFSSFDRSDPAQYSELLKQCLLNPGLLLERAQQHLCAFAPNYATSWFAGVQFSVIARIWDRIHMRLGREVDTMRVKVLFETFVGEPGKVVINVNHSYQLFYLKMLQSLDPPVLTIDSPNDLPEWDYLQLSRKCLLDPHALREQARKHFGIFAKGAPLIGCNEVAQSWSRIHMRLNYTADSESMSLLFDAFSNFCPHQGRLTGAGFELFYWVMLHALRPHLLEEASRLEEGGTGGVAGVAGVRPCFPVNSKLIFAAQPQGPPGICSPGQNLLFTSPMGIAGSNFFMPTFPQVQPHVGGGRFLIEGVLGKGCFGEVFKAEDRTGNFGRVAIKRIFNRGGNILKECLWAKKLEHPNVIRVLHQFEESGCLLVVMEFLPGGSLGDRLREDRGPGGSSEETWVAAVFGQVLAGISYCHSRDLVHNDIKPDNCLLANAGKALPRVVISDFGQASHATEIAGTKEMCGDPRYMPPEAWGEAENAWCHGVGSKAADVWMLGSTLFEMLSGGNLPFLPQKHVSLQQFRAAWASFPDFALWYRRTVKTGEPMWNATNTLGVESRSHEALDCCASMLLKSSALRFTCEKIIALEWFNQDAAQTESERLADEARKRILKNAASAATAHEDKIALATLVPLEEKNSSDVVPTPGDTASSEATSTHQVQSNKGAGSKDFPQVAEFVSPSAWLGSEPQKSTNRRLRRRGVRQVKRHGASGAFVGESQQDPLLPDPLSQTSSPSGCKIDTSVCIPEALVLQLHDITDLGIEKSWQLLITNQGNLEKAVRAHVANATTAVSKDASKSKDKKKRPLGFPDRAPAPASVPPPAPPTPPSALFSAPPAPPPPPPSKAQGKVQSARTSTSATSCTATSTSANKDGPEDMGCSGNIAHTCPWRKYSEPDSGRIWFWDSETEESFFEDQPEPWRLYITSSGRPWWWHESGEKQWFYDDEAQH